MSKVSEALALRAIEVMPGRQSNFRELKGADPLFLKSADGLKYTDVDGKQYLDFTLSMGAALWGYGDDEYKQAVAGQLDRLLAFSSAAAQSELEVQLAEAIVDRVPGAEWVRFGISGTEAIQLALRLARGYTGRPLFLRFEGHYHGWLDNVAGGEAQAAMDPPHALLSDEGPGATLGRSPNAAAESLMIPWNDVDALESTLQRYGDQVAAVLMEAVMCNNGCCPPREGYLERVRELCDHHGCLLIFDEVITGFRVSPGGAQHALGVTPDLATFGKALAGGLPLSAVAGRREVLKLLRENRVLGGGTFNSFQLGMAAGVINMQKLARDDFAAYGRMRNVQDRLAAGLSECTRRCGHQLLVQGPLGVCFTQFAECDVAWTPADLASADVSKGNRFRECLRDEGVLIAGGNRWFISPNHTDEDVQTALGAVERAMKSL